MQAAVGVHHILVMLCVGRALEIVKRVRTNSGYEAWRELRHENEPRVGGRMAGMLQQILMPKFSSNLQEFLAEWERMVDVYEMQSGEALADKIKIAREFAGGVADISPSPQW